METNEGSNRHPGWNQQDVPGYYRERRRRNPPSETLPSGEKKQEQEDKGKSYHRLERNYGTLYRTIELPVQVKAEEIKAEFKDGILMIDLPKVEEAKPKEISISVK
jgi:HSP20 family protein